MALTSERKNPSLISREIKFFSIFAWVVPTLVLKHNSRFRLLCFRSAMMTPQSVNRDDRLTFMKHLVERK